MPQLYLHITKIINYCMCNAFSKWSSWADLYIRVNKCHTFGIKKSGSKAVQYKPIVKISGQLVPPIEDGQSFMYLGKQFNFKMDCILKSKSRS